jgi:hypothetical protein
MLFAPIFVGLSDFRGDFYADPQLFLSMPEKM